MDELKEKFEKLRSEFQDIKVNHRVAKILGGILGIGLIFSLTTFFQAQKELELYKEEVKSLRIEVQLLRDSIGTAQESFTERINQELASNIETIKNELTVHGQTVQNSISGDELSLIWDNITENDYPFEPEKQYRIYLSTYDKGQPAYMYPTVINPDYISVSISQFNYLIIKSGTKNSIANTDIDGSINRTIRVERLRN